MMLQWQLPGTRPKTPGAEHSGSAGEHEVETIVGLVQVCVTLIWVLGVPSAIHIC